MPNQTVTLTRSADELRETFFDLRTARDLADLLEVKYGHMNLVLYGSGARNSYKSFVLKKRSGGDRVINVPPYHLADLQKRLLIVLSAAYRRRGPVHGFTQGKSIVSNAVGHAGKRFVLGVDLEDYFPSVNFGRVYGMLQSPPYSLPRKVATVIAQICCEENELPQGAATSPIVANMVSAPLDNRLLRLASSHNCYYTRYADDITFSTNLRRFPEAIAVVGSEGGVELGPELLAAVNEAGFRINTGKSRLKSRAERQRVTGLIVNKFPNVPRRFVRQVRAMLHAWERYGHDAAEREFRERYDQRQRRPGSAHPSFRYVVKGRLAYLKMVKGQENSTYQQLLGKAHALDPDLFPAPAASSVGGTPEPATGDQTWAYWYQRYRDGVCLLQVESADGTMSSGTAFVWSGNLLATAAHNVTGDVQVEDPAADRMLKAAEPLVTHIHQSADVALCRAGDGWRSRVPSIPIRSEPLMPGEQVAAIAFPTIPQRGPALGLYDGVVESNAPDYAGDTELVQVTINISGGMSGAPVIDRAGKLVGVVAERTYERVGLQVPSRSFNHIVPVAYLSELQVE